MTGAAPALNGARVLVVDDDPTIGRILGSVLAARGIEVTLAGTAAEGEAVLAEQDVALVVLDLFLPDADGRVLLRRLRAHGPTANLPVLIATSGTGQELRAECFELGADAFVEKPFDAEVLAAQIASHVQRAAARERRAHYDMLTGLRNLAGLLHDLDAREGGPRGLVMAELDGLHEIWDRYGWGTSEMIVTEVGRALARALPDAVLARPSGGEFAWLLDGPTPEVLREAAARLRDAARSVSVSGPDGETFRLTASAAWGEDEGKGDAAALVEVVRTRVERAVAAGGNRVWAPAEAAPASESLPLVFVAEDDDITAKILSHRLEKDAFRVLRFDNGQEAYRRALDETPALVLLDVKMPGMDGFEILSRLRRTPSYDRVPIVMLTSLGSESDVVRGFDLGADDYILKPFSPTELVARIRRLIRKGHVRS